MSTTKSRGCASTPLQELRRLTARASNVSFSSCLCWPSWRPRFIQVSSASWRHKVPAPTMRPDASIGPARSVSTCALARGAANGSAMAASPRSCTRAQMHVPKHRSNFGVDPRMAIRCRNRLQMQFSTKKAHGGWESLASATFAAPAPRTCLPPQPLRTLPAHLGEVRNGRLPVIARKSNRCLLNEMRNLCYPMPWTGC